MFLIITILLYKYFIKTLQDLVNILFLPLFIYYVNTVSKAVHLHLFTHSMKTFQGSSEQKILQNVIYHRMNVALTLSLS